ncbi:MAG TPA: hypothetical protein VGP80_00865 [Gemmatimonadales bacterium]|nr:hypothetical protein [Gemmatimonadales bacterium]
MPFRVPCSSLLIAFLVLAAGSVRRGYAQDGPEPVLVQLEMGRLASRTVYAIRQDDDVLLPLSDFFDLSEIHFAFPSAGVVDAVLQPGEVHLRIDGAADSLTLNHHRIGIPANAVLSRDGEVFFSVALLGSLLNIRFIVDWSDLSVAIADPEHLPVGRRIAREAARSSLAASERGVRPDLALTLDRRHWGGLVLDYSLLSPTSDMINGGAYSTALGMDVLGGSLELGVASESRIGAGGTRSDFSWNGVWRQEKWVKQLRLGDGISTGPRPRTLRGFAISNSPFQRPALVGDVPYAGRLGPGWQVEAYRGGRLVAFDSADGLGQFSIDVPVQYGENPVDFVAYGPFGEIREFNQTYRVVGNVLPRNQFEYGVAAGQCRVNACQSSANLDLRYGISRRWTLQAGVDQFWRRKAPDLFHPYLSLAGAVANSWLVQVDVVANAVFREALSYEPSTDFRISTEYDHFAPNVVSPILTPAGRREQWTTDAFFRPIPRFGSLYFDGSLDLVRNDNGHNTSARAALSFQVAEIRVLPSVRFQRNAITSGPTTDQTFLGVNTFILPRANLGRFMSQVSARTTLETRGSLDLVSASAYLARPIGSGLRVETGLGWSRGMGTMFTLVFSTALQSIRAYSTVQSGPTGTDAVNYVQGSVLYNTERRQVALSAGPSLQRAGVAGYVFLDANGNGLKDIGEELLPDVRVRVGNITAVTDSQGQYRIWDQLPYEPVLVVVDSMSLASPLWTPSYSAISVELGPNQFRMIDLPIAPAGVIEGQVLRETPAGPVGQGGITLFVTNRRSGARQAVVTFSDGAFYLMGVKPGEYDITVAESVLTRLGVNAAPVRFTMRTSREGENVSGLEIRLSHRP